MRKFIIVARDYTTLWIGIPLIRMVMCNPSARSHFTAGVASSGFMCRGEETKGGDFKSIMKLCSMQKGSCLTSCRDNVRKGSCSPDTYVRHKLCARDMKGSQFYVSYAVGINSSMKAQKKIVCGRVFIIILKQNVTLTCPTSSINANTTCTFLAVQLWGKSGGSSLPLNVRN